LLGDPDIEILDPVAPLGSSELRLTARPTSLRGLSVAILTTEGKNSRELLEAVTDLLRERDGVTIVRHRSRHGGGEYDDTAGEKAAARPEPIDVLARKVDLGIAGVGL
jgi:hypothetical protein